MKEPPRVIPNNIGRLMSPEDQKRYGFETIEARGERLEMQLERDLHNMLIAYLRRHEFGYYHADPTRKSTIQCGMPDFGVFRNSRIVWIEFKTGKNKVSPDQKEQIGKMLTDDNTIHVVYSYQEAIEKIEQFFRDCRS